MLLTGGAAYAQSPCCNTNTGVSSGVGFDRNSNYGAAAGENLPSDVGSYNSNFGVDAGHNILTLNKDNPLPFTLDGKRGSGNSNFGVQAGFNIGIGKGNSNIGFRSGLFIDAGNYNTTLGASAGEYIQGKDYNTFIGAYSGNKTSGTYNTFIGTSAGRNVLSGNDNVFLGNNAGTYLAYGNDSYSMIHGSVILGSKALNDAYIKGGYNVVIGYSAGRGQPFPSYQGGLFLIQNQANLKYPLLYGKFAFNRFPDDPAKEPDSPAQLAINTTRLMEGITLTVEGPLYVGRDLQNAANVNINLRDKVDLWVERAISAEDLALAPKSDWGDFVFENEYDLRPLQEVESFIKNFKHLPEVPSAAEISAHGYNLHSINRSFMVKLEELTLYAIEQEKEISMLKEKITMMESTLAEYKKLADEMEAIKRQLKKSN